MSSFLASVVIVLLHVLVAVLTIRLVLHGRFSAMRRFEMDVTAGRYLVAVEIEVEDPKLGYLRSMIEGVTAHADFTILRVVDLRNGRAEYNLRIDDLYYGAWRVKDDRFSRLARLYRMLRAP